MKYRARPIEIEAVQVIESSGDPEDIAEWCGGRVLNNFGHPSGKVAILILENEAIAQYGDWIVKGLPGGCRPMTADVFEANYEAIEDDAAAQPTTASLLTQVKDWIEEAARGRRVADELNSRSAYAYATGKRDALRWARDVLDPVGAEERRHFRSGDPDGA